MIVYIVFQNDMVLKVFDSKDKAESFMENKRDRALVLYPKGVRFWIQSISVD